jgi:acetyl esterase/lipase
MATLISESDQKILNAYTAMIQQSMKETAAMPNTPENGLKGYRAMMLRINPYKFPPGFKSKDVASFEPKRELRPGLTASISIPKGTGPFPIMIHAHGHGLRAGSSPEYEPWIREMSSYGFVVIFPDYRWQPEHTYEDQIDDMAFSVKWARENAARISGNPDRLILGGDSAGGGLAFDLLARTLEDPNGPRFIAFESVDGILTGTQRPDGTNNLSKLKPEMPIPPVYMIVGSADGLSRASLQTGLKLLELKKDYTLDIFYGMPHDFAKFPELDVMHEANRRLMEFLKKV